MGIVGIIAVVGAGLVPLSFFSKTLWIKPTPTKLERNFSFDNLVQRGFKY
jgi:hypothetical protein